MLRIFLAPAGLATSDKRLLLLLGAAYFVGQYDMTVLTLALPDLQQSFGIAEEDLGKVVGAARLGALPALLFALLADRAGRRVLLMVTLLGLSIATGLTGFARTAEEFIAIQFCARGFATAEEVIAVIYVLEMLPTRHRGWGVGFLAAMGGLGSGAASLIYGMVNFLPGGWRALYVLAAIPILYLAWLRRLLPESALFQRHRGPQARLSILQPLLEIFRHQKREIVVISLIAATFWFHLSAALNFMSKYLQEVHAYEPLHVSVLFIVAGSIAILGNSAAGRLSDHFGRRPTLIVSVIIHCAATIAFYNTGGALLPLAWIATLFSFFAIDVIVNAVSGELFSTQTRSTASTLRSIFAMLAAVAGLAAEGSLFVMLGSHEAAISLLSLTALLTVPIVMFMLRETADTALD